MNVIIALAPDLGLDAAVFVATWNDDPHATPLAQAQIGDVGARTFDPILATAVLSVAGSITLGVLSNFLTDWIRDQWRTRHPEDRERILVTQAPQPDGSQVLVVTVLRD